MKKSNYTGNKNIPGVYQTIINNIPLHDEYFEPFAGSAAIARKLFNHGWNGSKMFINDIDEMVTENMDYPPNSIVTNLHAVHLLKQHRDVTAKKFFFLDPPYMFETRSRTNLYKYEMTNEHHIQLLTTIKHYPHPLMIIHPKCTPYDSMLAHFQILQLKIRYHNKTSVENLYMNYPPVKHPMVTAFLGADCWKRQRIKRNSDYSKRHGTLPIPF